MICERERERKKKRVRRGLILPGLWYKLVPESRRRCARKREEVPLSLRTVHHSNHLTLHPVLCGFGIRSRRT